MNSRRKTTLDNFRETFYTIGKSKLFRRGFYGISCLTIRI